MKAMIHLQGYYKLYMFWILNNILGLILKLQVVGV